MKTIKLDTCIKTLQDYNELGLDSQPFIHGFSLLNIPNEIKVLMDTHGKTLEEATEIYNENLIWANE